MADFKVSGIAEVEKRLAQLADDLVNQAGHALRVEGELIMTEAKKRTPVDTGALRASGHVTGPDDSKSQKVRLAFGGAAAPYAVFVHENLNARHHVGRAKFLESAALEAAPKMADRIAKRIGLK